MSDESQSQFKQKQSLKIETAATLETATTSFDLSVAGDLITPTSSSSLMEMTPKGGEELVTTPMPQERNTGPRQPSPPFSRSSPERVIDSRKTISCICSRLFTDSSDLLPFGLHPLQEDYEVNLKKTYETFKYRCMSLQIEIMEYGYAGDAKCLGKKDGEGQAFIFKKGEDVFMATVKHNFCSEVNMNNIFEECNNVYPVYPGSSGFVKLPFRRNLIGWDADGGQEVFKPTDWKYGNELLLVKLNDKYVNDVRDIRGHFDCFETISEPFEIKKEMNVGIMAHSNIGLLARSIKNQLTGGDDGDEEYEGMEGDIFITVGKITDVGDEHMEYSANTVHGFSGAPVFLLSPGDDHHMKVVAVHAGNKREGYNFGFLI